MWKKSKTYTKFGANGTTTVTVGENKTSTIGTGGFGTIWLIVAIFLWINPPGIPGWVMLLCQIIFWVGVAGLIFAMLVIIVFAIIWIRNN